MSDQDIEVPDVLKHALAQIDTEVKARQIDTVEDAAILYMDAKELKRIGDREANRAKKILKGYDPGEYGEIVMWLEAVNRQYPDMEAITAFYAQHGEPVPYKAAQASIHVDFVDKQGPS